MDATVKEILKQRTLQVCSQECLFNAILFSTQKSQDAKEDLTVYTYAVIMTTVLYLIEQHKLILVSKDKND